MPYQKGVLHENSGFCKKNKRKVRIYHQPLRVSTQGGLGGRLGRTTRKPRADTEKEVRRTTIDVIHFHGFPKVSKMIDTSAGMKTRRVSCASSDVEALSRSRSFIRLQAERGAMAGKYNCASSIRPYVLIDFSILQSYEKITKLPNISSRK